jgi:hypothetical protein
MQMKSLCQSLGMAAVMTAVVSTLQAQNPNKITKSENFDSAFSAEANGWVEMGSRANGENFGFRACLETRPVRAPGLQWTAIPANSCRPCALTRRVARISKQALRQLPFGIVETRHRIAHALGCS